MMSVFRLSEQLGVFVHHPQLSGVHHQTRNYSHHGAASLNSETIQLDVLFYFPFALLGHCSLDIKSDLCLFVIWELETTINMKKLAIFEGQLDISSQM